MARDFPGVHSLQTTVSTYTQHVFVTDGPMSVFTANGANAESEAQRGRRQRTKNAVRCRGPPRYLGVGIVKGCRHRRPKRSGGKCVIEEEKLRVADSPAKFSREAFLAIFRKFAGKNWAQEEICTVRAVESGLGGGWRRAP